MANFLQEMVRTQPHSIDEIRTSLDVDLADHMQFIPILKKHHNFLTESIAIVLDEDSTDFQRQEHLVRFFRIFEMHGRAEQEVLYNHLKANTEKEARIEGYGGQGEHDLAFQLESELEYMDYQNQWNEEIAAKAKVLVSLVKNHIKEEEKMMFPIAVAHMTEIELEDMRDSYVQKCIGYIINERAEVILAGSWKQGIYSDSDNFRL
jgi:hemerythrin-like domain-containing protein